MKGEMDLDDHYALSPSYRDLVFYLLGLPHSEWADTYRRNKCKGKQWIPPRADGAHSFAMPGEKP